jgi:hypothetical protein
MRKTLPLLTGLALLSLAALVHGVWTGRWQTGHALEDAIARVREVPLAFGDWKAEELPADHEEFTRAGASGYWRRLYRNCQSGEAVTVLLMCGRAGKMAVHTPDLCYGGVGYEMVGEPARAAIPAAGAPAEFWSARFRKPGPAGDSALRIHWAWSTGAAWEGPERPRWYFAGAPFLYKLYIVRDATADGPEGDPSLPFLQTFLPELEKTLFRPTRAAAEKL